jgi:effector-binding domain-containing protein
MTTHLNVEPSIVHRPAQPYVAVAQAVTMRTIPEIADRVPEVFGWLVARGIPPAGPVLFRYNVIDMARDLQMEVGVPVTNAVEGDAEIVSGVLPAGRYATLTHVGHPSELEGVTAALLGWAVRQGLTWDKSNTPDGERWGCRLEWYKSDPAVEPDMTKWETELAFRLAD